LPSFSLTSLDLPELKDWEMGGVYFLKLKVEITQAGKGEYGWGESKPGDKTMNARFQVLGVEVISQKENYQDEYARRREKAARS